MIDSRNYTKEYTKDFVSYWDDLIGWEGRERGENGFFQRMLTAYDARTVLDCACGTGFHSVTLARTCSRSRPAPLVTRPVEPNAWYVEHITSPKTAAAGGSSRSWNTTTGGRLLWDLGSAEPGTATWINGSHRQSYSYQAGVNTGGEDAFEPERAAPGPSATPLPARNSSTSRRRARSARASSSTWTAPRRCCRATLPRACAPRRPPVPARGRRAFARRRRRKQVLPAGSGDAGGARDRSSRLKRSASVIRPAP